MILSAETHRQIKEEIGHFPNPRGALLEALHRARRERGKLSSEIFEELAALFKMRANEVAEVASFYPLFNIPPARACFQVCTNLSCALRGAREIVERLERRLRIKCGQSTADGSFSLCEVQCLGSCGTAPVVQVNGNPYLENATADVIEALTASPAAALEARRPAPLNSTSAETAECYLLPPDRARWLTIDDYKQHGGYEAILKAGQMAPHDIAKLVEDSTLRGRGGAGFVTGKKWSFMPPKDGGPRYLAVNADESEPGTFKDREIMQRNPHLLLEGIMIAATAIEADAAYIYMRAEYTEAFVTVREAIGQSYSAGVLGEHALGFNRPFNLHLQRGAGAYICGEESGMLESMEGKKGQPRKRPPYPAQHGLWGRPTTVDNVETLSHVPAIVMRGAQWFRSRGAPKSGGHGLFGISGHVNQPGVYELPMGTKLRDLINKYAGGVTGGRAIKAVIPGGVSMPVLTAEALDVSMDFESVRSVGTYLGTGGVIVMDDRTCIVRVAGVVARFFEHESCGQCTQCREGTGWIHRTLTRIESGAGVPQDLENLASCASFMDGQTICALSDGAAWSARAFLERFRSEFEAHVEQHRCPLPESFKP